MADVIVDARGCRFAVRTIDPPGEPSRPPVVWGHGLSSSMESEDQLGLIDWSIAAPGRRIVRYDARGHGRSDSTADLDAYRWDRLAADQLTIADAVGIDRYVAAGASMGCATALFAALAAPARVERLVLVIPPTGWASRAAQTSTYAASAELLEAGNLDLLLRGVDASPTPDPFVPVDGGPNEWKERSRRTIRTTDPVRLARVFRGAGLADLPSLDELATIGQPALILAWSGDPGHPLSTAERLVEIMPDAHLHVAMTRDDVAGWSYRIRTFLL